MQQQRTQFIVLTGHLDEQPLPDIFRTLRVQRKTGRLQVEYADAPGAFFFEDGQLLDAHLGTLRGLEAVYAALALPGAAFNFNPLVRPPERSIDRQQQKFIADLSEASRRESLPEFKLAAGASLTATDSNAAALAPSPPLAQLQLAPLPAELVAPLEARLTAVEAAIISTSRRFSRERLIYAVIISFLVGLTLLTALQALFGSFLPGRAPAPDAVRAIQPAIIQPTVIQPATQTEATHNPTGSGPGQPATETATGAATTAAGTPTATGTAEPAAGNSNTDIVRGRAATAPLSATTASSNAPPKRAENAPRPVAQQPSSSSSASGAAVTTTAGDARAPDAVATPRGEYSVNVLMQVKDGRVTEARVLNPRPGAGAYEALALRMARQRRYPDTFTGGERLQIKVKP